MSTDRIGITTSLPIEVIIASGRRPVDLNNLFMAGDRASERVELAERRGFPRTVCAWVKGIYATVLEEGIETVVGVVRGDCSQTLALLEVLRHEGVEVIHFDYPAERDGRELDRVIRALEGRFGVDRARSEAVREGLVPMRERLRELDRRIGLGLPAGCAAPSTAKATEGSVRHSSEGAKVGARAHEILVSGSDLAAGRPEELSKDLEGILARLPGPGEQEKNLSESRSAPIRLALAGVPPIISGLFERVEELGGTIVLMEMAREFAMVRPSGSLIEQYLNYTYPYDIFYRTDVLARECRRRRVEGLVHYVQSFCFRTIQDRLIRERLDLPVLTLEGDRPSPIDERTATRIETFLEVLRSHRSARGPKPSAEDSAGEGPTGGGGS